MSRIVAIVAKVGPLAAQLVPLARQAWPIVLAILAVLADKTGATAGAATPTALGVGLLAAGHAAGRRSGLLGVVAEAAQPLMARGLVDEVPVFEFHADGPTGRHRVTSVSLHGSTYPLDGGPALYYDVTPPHPDEGGLAAVLANLRGLVDALGVRLDAIEARPLVEYLDPDDLDDFEVDASLDDEDFDDDVDELDDDDDDDRTAREQLGDVAGEALKLRPETLTMKFSGTHVHAGLPPLGGDFPVEVEHADTRRDRQAGGERPAFPELQAYVQAVKAERPGV